jgi:hypothetical protein
LQGGQARALARAFRRPFSDAIIVERIVAEVMQQKLPLVGQQVDVLQVFAN